MKTATYQTNNGPIEVSYDPDSPCVYCELPVIEASVGGTAVCPACDCGRNRDGSLWDYATMQKRFENYRRRVAAAELAASNPQ
jgi:hypothetical protein